MKNLLKEKLLKGEKCIGTFYVMGGSTAVEALSYADMDFMIIDTEHGPYDIESSQEFIRTAKLSGMTPCARVKDHSRTSILKMLDIGAEALIIPCIETVEEVKKIVQYGKYFPLGRRGVALGRAAGFGYKPFATENGLTGYFETCNRETMLIPQCETLGVLENIEEIAQIEGVDGIFIGPYDLSVALGKPGQFGDAEFKNAVDRVNKAVHAAGKFLFTFTGSVADTKRYFEEGIDAVTISTDIKLYIAAMKKTVEDIRQR